MIDNDKEILLDRCENIFLRIKELTEFYPDIHIFCMCEEGTCTDFCESDEKYPNRIHTKRVWINPLTGKPRVLDIIKKKTS